jgi:acetyltransferase-like isoleucine patch superfamily enzyme
MIKKIIIGIVLLTVRPIMIAELWFRNIRGGYDTGFSVKAWICLCRIQVGKRFYLRQPIYLFQRGNLKTGNDCSFGEFTRIWNYSLVTIGDNFLGGPSLTLLTGGHNPETLDVICKPILIGNGVWVGANVTILPGVTIGDDVTIGAGAVISKDIPSGVVVIGNPARVLRKIDCTKRRKTNDLRNLI